MTITVINRDKKVEREVNKCGGCDFCYVDRDDTYRCSLFGTITGTVYTKVEQCDQFKKELGELK